jgi:hypothetical protein
VFDIKHAQNKLSSFQHGSNGEKLQLTKNVNVALVGPEILIPLLVAE